jgi:hypothetical protein
MRAFIFYSLNKHVASTSQFILQQNILEILFSDVTSAGKASVYMGL